MRGHGPPPTEQATDQNVSSSSPWNTQLEFWITPYGFLKAARANTATLETKSVYGEAYRIVTVLICGEIMTMPGLPKIPRATKIDLLPDGRITGLF